MAEPTEHGPEDSARDEGATDLRVLPLDRYREYRPVGEGGMGIVYWAIDSDLNREVALKIIRPGTRRPGDETPEAPLGVSPPERDTPASKAFETLKSRFLQEAWVTGGMAHPGIVPVYELGQTPEGVPYYTMRFIKGSRTLSKAIEELAGHPVEERLALLEPFLKVCDAIAYAHAHGVIHRDLKPENIALGEFGEAVVLDWGLAKPEEGPDVAESVWRERIIEYREISDLKTLGTAMGTPGYMSPEAAMGDSERVDFRSDVYSLGAILFQILTGKLPFEFESYLELIRKLRDEAPPAPLALDPEVPEGLSDLCGECLSRDMDRRPASAEVLGKRIRQWQARRAADLEVAGLLREAKGALQDASGLGGDALLRQIDRAGAACSQVLAKRPESAEAASIREVIDQRREEGIARRERAARGKVLRRGGVALLVVATIATVLVALTLEDRRRRAEEAEGVAARERDEKDAAYRRAEGLRLAAHSQAALSGDPSLALALAAEAGKLHMGPQVRNALQAAIGLHRSQRRIPLAGESPVFSPDSRRVAVRAGSETRVLNMETGELDVRIVGQAPTEFDARGSRMLTGFARGFTVWDTGTWDVVRTVETEDRIWIARLSPDGESVAALGFEGDRNVWVWDLREDEPPRLLKGHTGDPMWIGFSPDGDRLVSTSEEDRTARIWEVATGGELLVLRGDDDDLEEVGQNGERNTIADYTAHFTTDGSRIVTGSANGTLRLWDAESGELIDVLEEFARVACRLRYAAGCDRIHLWGWGVGASSAAVWEPMTGRLVRMRVPEGMRGGFSDTAISIDGRRILHTWNQDSVVRVLDAESGEEVQTLGIPGETPSGAVFSPDGRWILISTEEGRILRLWDARSRDERRSLDLGHRGAIERARLSLDGSRLTTFGEHDDTAIVRDVETGRILSATAVPERVWGKPSPDGSVAVQWKVGKLPRVVDVSSGRVTVDFGARLSVDPLEFSTDGRLFAASVFSHPTDRDSHVFVMDTRSGETVAEFPWNGAVSFDRSGKRIAVTEVRENEPGEGLRFVHVHDVEEGRITWSYSLPNGVWPYDVSLDGKGKRLVAWGVTDAFVVEVGSDRPLCRLSYEAWKTEDVTISADGARVLTRGRTVRVWNAETGKLLFELPHQAAPRASVRWSPRGRRLLTAEWDGAARVRNGDTGKVLLTLRGHEMPLRSAEYSGDGRRIVTISHDHTAKVWDAETGGELLSVGGHRNDGVSNFWFLPCSGNVLTLTRGNHVEVRNPQTWALLTRLPEPMDDPVLSPDGSLVACCWGRSVWDTRTGLLVTRFGAAGQSFASVEFDPDGSRLLTVGKDDSVRIWNARSGEELQSVDFGPERFHRLRARFGRAGKLVLMLDQQGQELVFDASSGKWIDRPFTEAERRSHPIERTRQSPDGRGYLFLPLMPDERTHERDILIMSLTTDEERMRFKGHTASAHRARFGPGGKLVVSASADRTARIWDAESGAELMSLAHRSEVRDAAISPDGAFLVTLADGKLRRIPMDPLAAARALGPRPLWAWERRRLELDTAEDLGRPPIVDTVPDTGGLRLYEKLLVELGSMERVRARLASDDSLKPADREDASKIRLRAETHGAALHNRAWRAVAAADRSAEEYAEAVRDAEAAVRLLREKARALATLAKAKYRTGAAAEALAMLEAADRLRTDAGDHGIPTDIAFLAMAYHSLGRIGDARAALERYRRLLDLPKYLEHPSRRVLEDLLAEVKTLLD